MLLLFPLSLYVCGMCSGTDTEYRNVWTYYSSDVAMILSEAGKNISVKVEITTFNEGQNVSDSILSLIVTDDLESAITISSLFFLTFCNEHKSTDRLLKK